MKLQDYAKFYIGCRCFNTWFLQGHEMYDRNWQLKSIDIYSDNPYGLNCYAEFTWTDSIKLILRKLEDITNEECEAYNYIMFTCHSVNKLQDQMKTNAAMTKYLLEQRFDLFGLIDAGLAIDSKTLK